MPIFRKISVIVFSLRKVKNMVWTQVCNIALLPTGTTKQFNVKDCEVLLINIGDKIFCLDARCTHAGAPLEEGQLDGEILTCPWHGSQFQVTDGKVIKGPAEKQLRTYLVNIKDDKVFIEL
jgi:nitrite reductase/ring-hydroxylating ferredoxin subunit